MPRYRMRLDAELRFSIVADNKKAAMKRARDLADRLDDGVDVPNADTEDELESAIVYPAEDARLKIIDTQEEEDE